MADEREPVDTPAPGVRTINLRDLAAVAQAAERNTVAALMTQMDRLQHAGLVAGAVIVPPFFAPGVTGMAGLRVIRADVDEPMIAIRGLQP